jgi:hypothetical protein
LQTGYVTFFSRSRNTLWTKGETSGNRLAVRHIFTDCDEDTVLVKADREGDGNVCHTGQRSCFYTEVPSTRPAPSPAEAADPEVTEGSQEAVDSTQPMGDGAGVTVSTDGAAAAEDKPAATDGGTPS